MSRRRVSERGSMAVEVVILVPILVAVMLLVVGFGRMVDIQGEVESVARDAVRAASLERNYLDGQAAANAVAQGGLPNSVACDPVNVLGSYDPGSTLTVSLTCTVSLDGLGFAGFPGSKQMNAQASAPLDTFRRSG